MSISELSCRLGYDRKTIRKAIRSQEVGSQLNQGEKRKTSKLDPFKPYIELRTRFGVLNAERILREKGYTCGITILRELMKPLRSMVSAKATARFETSSGAESKIFKRMLTTVSGMKSRAEGEVFTLHDMDKTAIL